MGEGTREVNVVFEGHVGHPSGLSGRHLDEWTWAQKRGLGTLVDCDHSPSEA